MKYIILVGDGMSDRPLKELGGKTCLQAANTHNMDKIASEGKVGILRTIPRGFAPGSDVANLSILGYNPKKYYTGRAPIEAAYRGIKLRPGDVAYRCNLVTIRSGNKNKLIMEDYSSGHISSEDAGILIKDINKNLSSDKITFSPGVSYRHLMIWRNGRSNVQCTSPHDITGREINNYLPAGNGEDVLKSLIEKSREILADHPINKKRIKRGFKPANSIWLWGQGKKPSMPKFKDKYGLKGSLISAVDLTKGLGVITGFNIINVKGATGYLDTNYIGKARAALKALRTVDIVYLHVEAPDEAGHSGNYKDKIRAIEDFDSKVVGTVLKGMKAFKDYRILLLPDHATPIKVRTHTDEPVPFVIYDSRVKRKNEGVTFDESIMARKGIKVFEEGYKLMEYFIKGGMS
ncbi:MAG: cofactor-independent phosphoglycerate mutase [Nitrospirae bacterium]|nr:cofactor-independent phosphoglycerate mutase [Nitrospirota bacterium]